MPARSLASPHPPFQPAQLHTEAVHLQLLQIFVVGEMVQMVPKKLRNPELGIPWQAGVLLSGAPLWDFEPSDLVLHPHPLYTPASSLFCHQLFP